MPVGARREPLDEHRRIDPAARVGRRGGRDERSTGGGRFGDLARAGGEERAGAGIARHRRPGRFHELAGRPGKEDGGDIRPRVEAGERGSSPAGRGRSGRVWRSPPSAGRTPRAGRPPAGRQRPGRARGRRRVRRSRAPRRRHRRAPRSPIRGSIARAGSIGDACSSTARHDRLGARPPAMSPEQATRPRPAGQAGRWRPTVVRRRRPAVGRRRLARSRRPARTSRPMSVDRGPLDVRGSVAESIGGDERGSSGVVRRSGTGAADQVEAGLRGPGRTLDEDRARCGRAGPRAGSRPAPLDSGRAPRPRTRRSGRRGFGAGQIGLGPLGALVVSRRQGLMEAREPAGPVRREVAREGSEAESSSRCRIAGSCRRDRGRPCPTCRRRTSRGWRGCPRRRLRPRTGATTSTSRRPGSVGDQIGGVAYACCREHGDRVRRSVRPRDDALADQRPNGRPGASATDVVEQVLDDGDEPLRRHVAGGRRRRPSRGRWLRTPAKLADLRDRQDAVGHQEHGPQMSRGRRGPSYVSTATISRATGIRSARSASDRSDQHAPGRLPRLLRSRPPGALQPESSVATSWTASTCLQGPRSPRCRPYQGHVQVQPSAVDPDAVLDTTGVRRPMRRAPTHPRNRSEPHRPRRAAARREAVAGAARCGPGRTAARGGRSRLPRGRSRRCRTGRGLPARPIPLRATDRSWPQAPRPPAAAATRARRGPRR